MFNFIKQTLTKIYSAISSKFATLFGKKTINAADLHELEKILLAADTGVKTTRAIMAQLQDLHATQTLDGATLKDTLARIVTDILQKPEAYDDSASVYILVGINGSGKTTFASKLAHLHAKQGKKVLLVAADTFRAAAPEQLASWAAQTNTDIYQGAPDQDPAAVVYQGCQKYKDENYDVLIIDTAGRLQTKVNLMHELSKIKRVIAKQLADTSINTLLTIDSMLGQNSFEQATLFKESTDVNGIVLTKMDGTAKGGIIFGIADQLEIPIAYISYGETVEDLKHFDHTAYVSDLLNP